MSALRRVASAPGWVVGIWLSMLLCSSIAGVMVGSAAQTAQQPFAPPALGRESLFAVAQLTVVDPALMGVGITAPIAAGLGGVLAWMVLSGLVVARLAGTRDAPVLGEVWLRTLPAVLVQSIWHALLRAVALLLVVVSAAPLPGPILVLLLAAVWWISSLALDLTRTAIVLHDAAPWTPSTAAFAFVRAASRPRLLAATAGLTLLQSTGALAIVWLGLRAIGPSSSTMTTILVGLAAVVLGLWRIAIVVEHGRVPLHRTASPD